MINANFFSKSINIRHIEDSVIQLNYDIIYHSAFKTKKSLAKEQKELFILISIHKWMKENGCEEVSITYLGNLQLIHHQHQFEFHLNDYKTNTLSTVKFTM